VIIQALTATSQDVDGESVSDEATRAAFVAGCREFRALEAADAGTVVRGLRECGDTIEVATPVFTELARRDELSLEAERAVRTYVGSWRQRLNLMQAPQSSTVPA
jgi:ferritin-like metal-binding protein YciE